MRILISIFISGYHGKTTDFAKNSSYHRTTIAHFLNSGKWDDSLLSDTLKWCGYACWTAMVLDFLPYKQPQKPRKEKLGILRSTNTCVLSQYFSSL